MWIDIFRLIAGLVLILVGANMLTDGSASLARRWGMSDLVFGWFFGSRTITRLEGALLLLCYGGYMAWLLRGI